MNKITIYTLLISTILGCVTTVHGQQVATNHLIAAREYLKTNKQQLAKLELDSALMISPNNALANAMMGDLLNDKGQYLSALLSYDKAILANANDATLYIKRAELHTRLNNHWSYILGDYDKAIQLAPTNIEYYKKKAEYLANNNDNNNTKLNLKQAINTINEAIAIKKDDPDLYYLRSKYQFDDGQNLAALTSIKIAIVLSPTNDKYFGQKGYIDFMIGKYPTAMANYTRAINLNRENAAYYEFRGHIKYNLEKYAEAYEDYSQAIDLIIGKIARSSTRIANDDPMNKQLRRILLYRGMSLVQEDKPYDGCEDFERAYRMGETKARNYMRKYCN